MTPVSASITAALMAIGAGSASGLRPYLTVLLLGLARLLVPQDAVPPIVGQALAQIPEFLTSPWILGICAVLAIGDGGIDKVLGLNLPLEPINQILRPVLGALIGLQLGLGSGAPTATVTAVLGGAAALPVSLGKASLTAGLTAIFPEPISQVLRSLIEDFGAVGLVVAAVLAPIIAAVLGLVAVGIGIALFVIFRRAYRAMRARLGRFGRRASPTG